MAVCYSSKNSFVAPRPKHDHLRFKPTPLSGDRPFSCAGLLYCCDGCPLSPPPLPVPPHAVNTEIIANHFRQIDANIEGIRRLIEEARTNALPSTADRCEDCLDQAYKLGPDLMFTIGRIKYAIRDELAKPNHHVNGSDAADSI
jgi:hypothetical protein